MAKQSAKKKSESAKLPLTASNPSLLVDDTDQILRRLTLGFAVLGWLLSDIRTSFGKLIHLSPFQYVALQAIARLEHEEPWTTRILAAHFRVTNAYISMELRPLIRDGLLNSQNSSDDKRIKFLSITEDGLALLRTLSPVQQKVNDCLYSQFDQKSLAQQCETIERMVKDAEHAKSYLQDLLATRSFKS